MKVLICGVDGYIGYPLAQHLLNRGHEVYGVDFLYRRQMVKELGLESIIPIVNWTTKTEALSSLGDYRAETLDIACNYKGLSHVFETFKPEAIVNLAQQSSPAYSMISPDHANFTIRNNVTGLNNVFWAMRDYTPEATVTTLGTLGEWGQPNLNIPEGFFEVEFEGMTDILPFPRQTNSVYHASKVMNSDLGWFACRIWELRATDIHQGVVYGTRTPDMTDDKLCTRFDVGECFGTMVNRAVACAVMGHPIIPYGTGLQNRGYIALRDSIECLTLSVENHPTDDDSIHGYRVINQFDECYTVNGLAEKVVEVAEQFDLDATIQHVENPRIEAEIHYYNPHHRKLYKMGWKPSMTLTEELKVMFEDLIPHKQIMLKYEAKIIPKIKWRPNKIVQNRRNI